MNAKEAILQEPGDFRKEEKETAQPTVAADANPADADAWWKLDSSVDPTKLEPYDGNVDLTDMSMIVGVEEDDSETPKEPEAEEDDDSVGDMTNEEYDAKIDAAMEAMMDPTMPEEMFKKGLEYINKLAKKKRQSAKNTAVNTTRNIKNK